MEGFRRNVPDTTGHELVENQPYEIALHSTGIGILGIAAIATIVKVWEGNPDGVHLQKARWQAVHDHQLQ
eukprot:5018387-Amphidinium_carterae.1